MIGEPIMGKKKGLPWGSPFSFYVYFLFYVYLAASPFFLEQVPWGLCQVTLKALRV